MLEKIKLAKYVTENKEALDGLMQIIFKHWNQIGALDSNQEVSNKMQVTWLISMVRIWLTTSGMDKQTQKKTLEALLKSL